MESTNTKRIIVPEAEEILENVREKVFIYGRFVRGGGVIIFSKILELFGFSKATKNITEKSREEKRYFLITSKTSKEEVYNIINIFNSKTNKYGSLIQVIIGTPTIAEGFSFKCIRQAHIITPHWNNTDTEQAIGRCIRVFSHDNLNPTERYIKIYRHCSLPIQNDENVSIDYLMYQRSDFKNLKIKQIENLMKSVALDCSIMKERNNVETCLFSNPMESIVDTYNLMVGNDIIDKIEEIIRKLYRIRSLFHINELFKYVNEKYTNSTMFLLVKTLCDLIEINSPIINRYGFISYMREKNNLFFLVPRLTDNNDPLLSYYVLKPLLYEPMKFSEIVELFKNRKIEVDLNNTFKETIGLDFKLSFINELDNYLK